MLAGPPRRVGRLGVGERPLAEHDAERVELRIEPLDARERRLGDLARRHLARRDELRLARGAGVGQFGCVHGRRRRLVSSADEAGGEGLDADPAPQPASGERSANPTK